MESILEINGYYHSRGEYVREFDKEAVSIIPSGNEFEVIVFRYYEGSRLKFYATDVDFINKMFEVAGFEYLKLNK